MRIAILASLWFLSIVTLTKAEVNAGLPEDSNASLEHWQSIWKTWNTGSASMDVDYLEFNANQQEGEMALGLDEVQVLIDRIVTFVDATDSPELRDLESISQLSFPVNKNTGDSKGRRGTVHLILDMDNVRPDVIQ